MGKSKDAERVAKIQARWNKRELKEGPWELLSNDDIAFLLTRLHAAEESSKSHKVKLEHQETRVSELAQSEDALKAKLATAETERDEIIRKAREHNIREKDIGDALLSTEYKRIAELEKRLGEAGYCAHCRKPMDGKLEPDECNHCGAVDPRNLTADEIIAELEKQLGKAVDELRRSDELLCAVKTWIDTGSRLSRDTSIYRRLEKLLAAQLASLSAQEEEKPTEKSKPYVCKEHGPMTGRMPQYMAYCQKCHPTQPTEWKTATLEAVEHDVDCFLNDGFQGKCTCDAKEAVDDTERDQEKCKHKWCYPVDDDYGPQTCTKCGAKEGWRR